MMMARFSLDQDHSLDRLTHFLYRIHVTLIVITMTNDITLTEAETLAIDCTGLTYAFAEGLESALDGVDLQLKKGDRCLLVGANGGMYIPARLHHISESREGRDGSS